MILLQWLTTIAATFRDEILTLSYLLLSLASTFHILQHKRDSKAAIAWMGLAFLYLVFFCSRVWKER